MDKPPLFFIPGAAPDECERVYSALASACGAAVAPEGRRVFSIVFGDKGVHWTARVGEQLTGTEVVVKRVRGKRVDQIRQHSDSATVRAIFPGNPYIVWTDGNHTRWVNPFLAGIPTSVALFSTVE